MHISCPTCHFKRSVDSKQIPASATIATCPKCENKFRFRDPETGDLIDKICSDYDDVNASGNANLAAASSSSASVSNEYLGENAATRGTHMKDKASTTNGANTGASLEDNSGGSIAENIDENDESIYGHEKHTPHEVNPAAQSSAQKNTQEFTGEGIQNTENKAYSQAEKVVSTENSQKNDTNEDFDSYQNPTYNEDPKPLREEEITKKNGEEDRDNPLHHPQESSYKQPTNSESAKYQMVTDDVPWEHPERYGIVGSLVQTISRVMFRAPEFFSTIHSQSSALRPATFYALIGLFQVICLQIWPSLFDIDSFVNYPLLQKSVSSFSTPMTIMMSPFKSVLLLLLFSTFLYLAIRITNPEHADYNLILRIIAYANAPMVLVIVPFLGFFIGSIWFALNILIGVKYALRLTWQRTILALSPIFILWVFWLFVAVSPLSQNMG